MISNEYPKLDILFTTSVILMPVLNIYSSGFTGIGCGDFLLLIVSFLYICSFRKLVLDKYGYWLFIVYLIAVALVLVLFIDSYRINSAIVKIAKLLLYTFVAFSLVKDHFAIEYGIKLYIITALMASLYLLLQAIVHSITSIYLPMSLPFLNLSSTGESGETYFQTIVSGYGVMGYRYSGFFLEPATFGQYVSYALMFTLQLDSINWVVRHRFQIALIISVAVIMSFSAMGYILMCVVWVIWIFKKSQTKNDIAKKLVVLVFAVSGLVLISVKTGAYDSMLARLSTVTGRKVSTGNIRMLRGFEIYVKEPLIFKLIGIGFGNFKEFIYKYEITTRYDAFIPASNEYMSGLSAIFVYGGIVGAVLFSKAIIKLFKSADGITKSILMIWFLIFVSSSSFMSASFVLPMSLANAMIVNRSNKAGIQNSITS